MRGRYMHLEAAPSMMNCGASASNISQNAAVATNGHVTLPIDRGTLGRICFIQISSQFYRPLPLSLTSGVIHDAALVIKLMRASAKQQTALCGARK